MPTKNNSLPHAIQNTHWDDISIPEFPVGSNGWSLIMLEAWRRGLTVQLRANRRYTISSTDITLDFRTNRLATKEAGVGVRICNDKHRTKTFFRENGITTPQGELFHSDGTGRIKDEIIDAAKKFGYPLCLKAASWSKGKGVFPGIQDEEQLRKFIDVLVDDLQCKSIILEENFSGEDFRFFVVGKKVNGVIQRYPANVTGDGNSTIHELIQTKNGLRSNNPYLKNALIKVDAEVEYMVAKEGYALSSVLPNAKLLFLREKSNASAGGDSVDVTDLVSNRSKQLAVRAIEAIPGIDHGGVDVLLQNPFSEEERATVIEINQSAEMGLHLYPAFGTGTYPPSDVIDYYFPGHAKDPATENWYFNLADVHNLINTGVAKSVEINALPDISKLSWVEVTYAGKVQGVGFRNWLAREGKQMSIHGDVKNTSSGTVILRVCGRSQNLNAFLKKSKSNASPASIKSTKTRKIEPFRTSPGIKVLRQRSTGKQIEMSRVRYGKPLRLIRRIISKVAKAGR